jgi:NitT/TauT family transport system substrate-binding protein
MALALNSRTLSFVVAMLAAFAQAPVSAADKVTLQLNWLPSGQLAAVYAGRERGLFTQRNIDLEIKRGQGSTDTLTKIVTGAAEFGYVDIANLMMVDDAMVGKVKAIMSLFSKSPHAIITTTDRV